MPDMLVKLYDLPENSRPTGRVPETEVVIRRAMVGEKYHVVDWVRAHFSIRWAAECDVALSSMPPTCYIAVQNDQILGFACYDASCLNFFGPTGVVESHRGRGIGRELLFASLWAMRDNGYSYAIIGWVGPAEFYGKAVGATVIDHSEPGFYRGLLPESYASPATPPPRE